MSRPDPAAVLNGVRSGPWCDSCNRRIQHGEKAGLYATWYEKSEWTARRTWCLNCCPEEMDPATDSGDEVLLIGVFFSCGLVGLRIRDRCRSETS